MLVTFQIKDDLIGTLVARAHAASTTVDIFLEDTLRDALDQPAESSVMTQLIASSIQRTEKLEAGSEFSFDLVLEAQDWERMSDGERKSFGRRFRKEAEKLGIANWKRRAGNKAIYEKI